MNDDHITSTIKVYNSIATQYALQAEAHAPEPERQKFMELLGTKGKCILDVGCGSGRDAAYFEHHGFEVAGVDLSDSLLALAKKVAFNAEFYRMDMRTLTFPDNSYDGIWCCAAILHLKRTEIQPVIDSFFKILKPGGILFLLVKAGAKEGFDESPSAPGKTRYFTYFSKKEIQDYVTKSGLQLLDLYSFNEADRFKDAYPEDRIVAFAKKP